MKRILVVYKKSFLETHREDRKMIGRLSPAHRARFLETDAENRRTIVDVFTYLSQKQVTFDILWRGNLARRYRYDMIITVGGDGTYFAASHYVANTPILSINSDPRTSLALFACADRRNFKEKIDLALDGKLPTTQINRIEVTINHKRLPTLATNDVLFAHRNPAAMSRYILGVDGKVEEQRSSGIWVATSSGSTGGIRAAGGRLMKITATDLQYRVREPYAWPRSKFRRVHGFAQKQITMDVLMTEAAIWIDGCRIRHDLTMKDRVGLRTNARPLLLLGYDDRRRQKLFGS